jgi:hypothetical protein
MKKIKCKFCNKEIEGHTISQVEYLLNQHILSKHKDKFEVSKK